MRYSCSYPRHTFEQRAAFAYVRDQLDQGNRLAQALVQTLHLNAGTIYAHLPRDANREWILRFQAGGVASRTTSIECLASEIEAFLAANPDHVCVMEDALLRPSYPVFSRIATRMVVFENQVFHMLNHSDARSDLIERTIEIAEAPFLFIGVLTSSPEGYPLDPTAIPQTVDPQWFSGLASKTERLFIGAYDGEGYLVWGRGELP